MKTIYARDSEVCTFLKIANVSHLLYNMLVYHQTWSDMKVEK